MKSLLDILAADSHVSWSIWMRHMFSMGVKDESGNVKFPANLVDDWTRQTNTRYEDLTTEEKSMHKQNAESALGEIDNFISDAMVFTHDEIKKIRK